MYTDEYVPTTMPTSIAPAKSRISPRPKNSRPMIDNAVVVDDFSILNPEGLRYPDEFARHKLLDTLGDIATLGAPVLGALTVHKTGHALNQKLVARVLADSSSYDLVTARLRGDAAGQLELDELPAFAPSAA